MMENKTVNTYRRIVSSTAIFGGAQVLTVLVNIIRGKLVASILHSAGMGMSSVINNAANAIQQFSLMGLNMAAVPDVSKANTNEDPKVLEFTVRIVRRLVILASVLGLAATLALSPLISKLSFGTSGYTRYFLLLSVAVFFNVMGSGELAIMQGLRHYKRLAFCNIVPPCCALLLSIPIYYIWGVEGIVPAMIVLSISYYAVVRLLSYRYRCPRQERDRISLRTLWTHGSSILKFGMMITVSILVGTVTTYALTAFISRHGSLADVGFYQAGGAITTQYIGLIFTAMAADFYPHLSELLEKSTADAFRFVNQQMEIIVLIVAPMVMLLILSAPLAIRILLTEEFLTIQRMVCFLGLAGIFKALCFPMDYIAYASSDTRYILWVETIWGNTKTFTIIAGSYWLMGLDGLGYGALASSVIDFIVCLVLFPWRYRFHITPATFRLITVMTVLATACLLCSFITHAALRYTLISSFTLFSIVLSIRLLDRRMNLWDFLGRFKLKWSKRVE